jgi:hypothetical protein
MESQKESKAQPLGRPGQCQRVREVIGQPAADWLHANPQAYPVVAVVAENLQARLFLSAILEFRAPVLDLFEKRQIGPKGIIRMLGGAQPAAARTNQTADDEEGRNP